MYTNQEELPTMPPPEIEDAATRIARAYARERARHGRDCPGQSYTVRMIADFLRARLAIEFPTAKKTKRVAGRDPLFDAIAQACGMDLAELTRENAKQIGTAKRDILEATPDVTPDEIIRRADAYRARFPLLPPPSPLGLDKHWSSLGKGNEPRTRTARLDIYQEPKEWKHVVENMREHGNEEAIDAALAGRWSDLSPFMRTEVLKKINQ